MRVDGPFAAPAFLLVLVFIGAVVVPVTLYLHLVHPAWSWLYILDPAMLPALALFPIVVLHCGALLGGWYVGARLVRADRYRGAMYGAGGLAATFLLAAAIFHQRLGSYGTYDEFRAGEALDLMDVKLGYVLVPLGLAVVVAATVTAVELVRDSRRVRSW